MGSRVKFGPVRENGWSNPGKVPDADAQYFHPEGTAFVHMVGGRVTLADTAQALLSGWAEFGYSVLGKRFDPAANAGAGQVVVPGGDPIKYFADAGGTIYYTPTSQAYVEDTHRGARASLIGVSAPVVSGEQQLVDLADGAGTSLLRILDGDEGENAAYVAIAPASLQ